MAGDLTGPGENRRQPVRTADHGSEPFLLVPGKGTGIVQNPEAVPGHGFENPEEKSALPGSAGTVDRGPAVAFQLQLRNAQVRSPQARK